jgi:carotenoid cleavage dioxygenase-like enzyme
MSAPEKQENESSNGSHRKLSRFLWSTLRGASVAAVILAVALKFALQNASFLVACDAFLDSLQETKHHLAHHVYLHGNYAPVTEEHRAVPLQVVEGALPEDLDGLFVRNGPNPIVTQITKRYHWFDGHGMLHNVRIQSQPQPSATYSNSYIPTPRYEIEKKLKKEIFYHVGELTGVTGILKAVIFAPSIIQAFGLGPLTISQANTQTVMYDNKFMCCHEASLPFEVQLDNDGGIVKAVGFEDFGGVLDYPMSAHPKKDPLTGNFLFHGYAGDAPLVKRYGPIKVGEYDTQRHQMLYYLGVSPDDKHTSFAHDMLFTKNWIIVNDSSVQLDVSRILDPEVSFFNFNSAVTLRMGLVSRIGRTREDNATNAMHRDVVWIDTGTAYSMIHPLNAWEEDDGTVVLWSPLGSGFDGTLTNSSNRNAFYMTELRLDPKSRRLVSTKVIDANYNVEFSRVRDDCLGRFCRHGYSGISDESLGGAALFSGFVVWDMEKGELLKAVSYPSGDIGQEPVVLPKNGRNESNAVYLGTYLYNSIEQKSYFVLYDGENDYGVVAKLRIPYRVPYGTHGQWVPGEELQAHLDHHASKSQE